ncbi:FecR family protein [Flavihumibacter petaseus]|uniref:Putative anti-sigma factor n=1 Tax=Flavihumibacter petaseus NBRC 106054 TaxID=1220578 RepID=A0A0E9MYJ4_9BACT|nr:FecR domain-containing protein [Flavihumibacter petaseus]GAO42578.1 putative anti-sigma factor [Flavihumibacter petaseus NBRC 106054]
MEHQLDHIEELAIRKLAGDLSPAEDARFLELINADATAAATWYSLERAHRMLQGAKFAEKIDAGVAWQAIASRLSADRQNALAEENGATVISLEKRKRRTAWWWAAAIALPLMAGGVYWWQQARDTSPADGVASSSEISITTADGKTISLQKEKELLVDGEKSALKTAKGEILYNVGNHASVVTAMNTLTVPTGKDYHLVLSDGTEVWLNAASNLHFPTAFNEVNREVALEGEAFFKVTKNPQHPFLVKTNGMTVQVLGTSFNVKAYPQEKIQTSLVEGSVAIDAGAGKLELHPGEAAIMETAGAAPVKEQFDETEILAWMKGLYYFKNEQLRDILPVLQRWYQMEFVLSDPALGAIRYSGALNRHNTATYFLDILQSSSGITYRQEGNKVIISSQ